MIILCILCTLQLIKTGYYTFKLNKHNPNHYCHLKLSLNFNIFWLQTYGAFQITGKWVFYHLNLKTYGLRVFQLITIHEQNGKHG